MFHTLYLEITRQCNFTCSYCSSGSNIKEKWEPNKTADEIIEYILKPAKEIRTYFLNFSGGEPFLHPEFFKLLEIAHQMGFKIGISTNGSFINKNTIIKLKQTLGTNILISLGINSFDDENSKTRTKETEFFLNKLHLLLDHCINVNISITMGKFNCQTFHQSLQNIRNLSLPFNRIPYSPRNSGDYSLMFDKAIMKNYLHPALMESYHGFVSFVPLFLSPEDYEKYSSEKAYSTQVPLNPSVGCWVGSFYAINPAGDVAPCPLLSDHLSAGNVYQTSLKEILYKSDLMQKLVNRQHLKGKCGKCKYNWTCGGCRVMAYYLSGDVFAEDPTCFIDELTTKELTELEKKTANNFRNYVRMNEINKSRLSS